MRSQGRKPIPPEHATRQLGDDLSGDKQIVRDLKRVKRVQIHGQPFGNSADSHPAVESVVPFYVNRNADFRPLRSFLVAHVILLERRCLQSAVVEIPRYRNVRSKRAQHRTASFDGRGPPVGRKLCPRLLVVLAPPELR